MLHYDPAIVAPVEPITTLRGARVDADVRRVGRVLLAVCLAALSASVGVLFVAGLNRNAQITRLHEHGVPVELTVSKCIGLLSGSGSNVAGYQCTGTFRVADHSYSEPIPGSTLYAPGTHLGGVTVPGDPSLISTPSVVAKEHASSKVFILPAILLVVLAALATTLLVRRARLSWSFTAWLTSSAQDGRRVKSVV